MIELREGPTWALVDGKHVMFLLRVQLTRPPLAEEDSVLRRIQHMCIDLLCLDVHGAAHASIKTQWQDVVIITAHAFQVSAGGLV